jgi:hypothetical protein
MVTAYDDSVADEQDYEFGGWERLDRKMEEGDMRAVEIFFDSRVFDPLTALYNVKEFTVRVYRPACGVGAVYVDNEVGDEFEIPMKKKYLNILKMWKVKVERNYRIEHPEETMINLANIRELEDEL